MLIGQLVNLVKDGEPVRMSKRAGTVLRWRTSSTPSASTPPATRSRASTRRRDARPRPRPVVKRTERQPGVLRAVRARPDRATLRRNAGRRRHRRCDAFDPGAARPAATRPTLLSALGEFPRRRRDGRRAARTAPGRPLPRGPGRHLPPLVRRRAGSCRWATTPITDVNRARLWLNEATRVVLANGLRLLGVTAPERM